MSNYANRSDSQCSSSAAQFASSAATPTQSTSASSTPGAGPHAPAAGPPGAAHAPSPQTPNEPSTTCSPAGAPSSAFLIARGARNDPLVPLPVLPSGQSTSWSPMRKDYPTGEPVKYDAAITQAQHFQSHEVYLAAAADHRQFCNQMEDLSLKGTQSHEVAWDSQGHDSGSVQDTLPGDQISSPTPLALPVSSSSSTVTQTATEPTEGSFYESGPSDSVSKAMAALSTHSPEPAQASNARNQQANLQNPSSTLSTNCEQESQRLTPEVIGWIDNKRTFFREGSVPIEPFCCVDEDGDTYDFITFFAFWLELFLSRKTIMRIFE